MDEWILGHCPSDLMTGTILKNGPVHKGVNRIPKAVSERDSDPFLIQKPHFTLCERNALDFQIRLLKCEKRGVLDRDPPRKPDSEDL